MRHFILYHETLAPGESVTKTFNVHLADVYVSNEGGKVKDDVINISVSGRNAGLKSVSIKENEQNGKTIWCMTDSTGADQFTNVPYFGLQNYGGTGQALAKYINPEIAVSNQGEDGLDTTDTVHFNNALEQMKSGDYLYIQYGFNDVKDKAVYKNRLEKYYKAAHEKGVKTIIVSPTERQNTSANWDSANKKWTASNGIFAEAGKEFVDEKIAAGADDIAFVDVNTAFVNWMNEAMNTMLEQRKKTGFDDTEASTRLMEYYFRIGWTFGRDSVHINEAGADNAAYLFAKEAKKIIAADSGSVQAQVLAELMDNAADYTPYAVSDKIIENGYAPNASYPYPNTKQVELQYPTMIKAVDTTGGKLNSMTVKVQGNMDKYAQGVAELINESGETVKTIYTKSTDKNSAIGHIDNTACEYGELVTMYFDERENTLNSGYTYKAYVLPLENGADKPNGEPRYSSVYTAPAEIIDKLITSADGSGSEMFDYSINNGDTIKDQGANNASGASAWQLVGSATAQTFEKAEKDKMTAAHLYTNANGTFTITKFFNGSKTVSNGKIHLHFQLNHTYGQFGIKLTTGTKAASWMDGMQILTVEDGVIKLYDGTNAGEVKGGKWMDIDMWLDLDRCTEEVSIGGGDKVITADENGRIAVEDYIGKEISVVEKGVSGATVDSEVKSFTVGLKGQMPSGLTAAAPTTSANTDGKINSTTTAMQYKEKDNTSAQWQTCSADATTVMGGKTYLVRTAAVENTSFASEAAEVTVPEYIFPTYAVSGIADAHISTVTLTKSDAENGAEPDYTANVVEKGGNYTFNFADVQKGTYIIGAAYESGWEAGTITGGDSLSGATLTVDAAITDLTVTSKQIKYTVSGVVGANITSVTFIGTGDNRETVTSFTGDNFPKSFSVELIPDTYTIIAEAAAVCLR